MSHPRRTLATLAALTMLATAHRALSEPLFTLTDEGRTFLYHSRPGDRPGEVAEMFGVSTHDLPAFLAANGITDPTRVGAGFVYRIPNAAVRAVTERIDALQADNSRLQRALGQAEEQGHQH